MAKIKRLGISKKQLEEMYWGKGLSTNDIARLLGCTWATILYWMRKFNIRRRNLSEAGKLARKQGKIPNNFGGKGLQTVASGRAVGINCQVEIIIGVFTILLTIEL